MRRSGQRLAALAGFLAVGCAGVSTIGHCDQVPAYGPSFVSYAARKGQIPLVVHGDPFGLPAAETAQVLAARLRLPGWFADVPFAARSNDATTRQDYRVVLIANPARALTADEACGTLTDLPMAGRSAMLHLHASFCAPDGWLSMVQGRAPAERPESHATQGLLDQLMATLLPPRNRHHEADGQREFGPR